MAKNLIFIGKLNDRKMELESLRTAQALEIENLKQKLDTARTLSSEMSKKISSLELVKEYDPEYVASEIAAMNQLRTTATEKTVSLQAQLRHKKAGQALLDDEYNIIKNSYDLANSESIQVELLQTSIDEL
ncbi:hypothetical protein ACHAL6_00420 [Proteiniclasticum sp. C24MP]|uniref:hypothetical protein n=1 Tax=Proteiniclasticum sp. C24MP TaxID=3374101 RepID=UPI003754DC0A